MEEEEEAAGDDMEMVDEEDFDHGTPTKLDQEEKNRLVGKNSWKTIRKW